ncbi:putative Dynein heavy chain 6; axonemal [Paratrimastix pyriformis]|uniref:Dynein heavy chain 6 n=1 Tax=Paratrimastix pyriformis TaxID=342808 RepID=A0ABQ8UPI7_9EUKA|nr:putative Dynein heavy chain 6; axonemal [Paratrimastix pyriformis]
MTLADYVDFLQKIDEVERAASELKVRLTNADEMMSLLCDPTMVTAAIKPDHHQESEHGAAHSTQERFIKDFAAAVDLRERTRPAMEAFLQQSVAQLEQTALGVFNDLNTGIFVDDTAETSAAIAAMEKLAGQVDKFRDTATTFTGYAKAMKVAELSMPNVKSCGDRYQHRRDEWALLAKWNDEVAHWRSTEVSKLDAEAIATRVTQVQKEAIRAERRVPEDKVARHLRKDVEEFRPLLPILSALCIPAMETRHWQKLFAALERPFQPGLTLTQLVALKITKYKSAVNEISATANGEYGLQQQLAKIKGSWATMRFEVRPHKGLKGVYILGPVEEIVTLRDDNQATLQTMMASRFIVGIRDEVEIWDRRLSLLHSLLEEWLKCQHGWMYLSAIFGQADIARQLPSEAAAFLDVDKMWKAHMERVYQEPGVVACVDQDGLLDKFTRANEIIDGIQKGLEQYLETKRGKFPRLYFLSNDELLQILAQTTDPRSVQPFMSKCFVRPRPVPCDITPLPLPHMCPSDNIGSLVFKEDRTGKPEFITAMTSTEGETVPLSEPVLAKGLVEDWLLRFEAMMRRTVRDQLHATLLGFPEMPMGQWVFKFPAQV